MEETKKPAYRRILLKLSGEALSAGASGILNHEFIGKIAGTLKKCLALGVEIGVIVGAGNIWRGRQGVDMDPTTADHMGMLGTAINALALQDAFRRAGIDARAMTAVPMEAFAEPYTRPRAIHHLQQGRVVIFGCGLGLPFFSTDTAAALRAAEIEADVVLMAKNIDGVYTADPRKDPTARKLDSITYQDVISRGLAALDLTATSFCMDKKIPVLVFGLDDPDNILRAVMGEHLGTVIAE